MSATRGEPWQSSGGTSSSFSCRARQPQLADASPARLADISPIASHIRSDNEGEGRSLTSSSSSSSSSSFVAAAALSPSSPSTAFLEAVAALKGPPSAAAASATKGGDITSSRVARDAAGAMRRFMLRHATAPQRRRVDAAADFTSAPMPPQQMRGKSGGQGQGKEGRGSSASRLPQRRTVPPAGSNAMSSSSRRSARSGLPQPSASRREGSGGGGGRGRSGARRVSLGDAPSHPPPCRAGRPAPLSPAAPLGVEPAPVGGRCLPYPAAAATSERVTAHTTRTAGVVLRTARRSASPASASSASTHRYDSLLLAAGQIPPPPGRQAACLPSQQQPADRVDGGAARWRCLPSGADSTTATAQAPSLSQVFGVQPVAEWSGSREEEVRRDTGEEEEEEEGEGEDGPSPARDAEPMVRINCGRSSRGTGVGDDASVAALEAPHPYRAESGGHEAEVLLTFAEAYQRMRRAEARVQALEHERDQLQQQQQHHLMVLGESLASRSTAAHQRDRSTSPVAKLSSLSGATSDPPSNPMSEAEAQQELLRILQQVAREGELERSRRCLEDAERIVEATRSSQLRWKRRKQQQQEQQEDGMGGSEHGGGLFGGEAPAPSSDVFYFVVLQRTLQALFGGVASLLGFVDGSLDSLDALQYDVAQQQQEPQSEEQQRTGTDSQERPTRVACAERSRIEDLAVDLDGARQWVTGILDRLELQHLKSGKRIQQLEDDCAHYAALVQEQERSLEQWRQRCLGSGSSPPQEQQLHHPTQEEVVISFKGGTQPTAVSGPAAVAPSHPLPQMQKAHVPSVICTASVGTQTAAGEPPRRSPSGHRTHHSFAHAGVDGEEDDDSDNHSFAILSTATSSEETETEAETEAEAAAARARYMAWERDVLSRHLLRLSSSSSPPANSSAGAMPCIASSNGLQGGEAEAESCTEVEEVLHVGAVGLVFDLLEHKVQLFTTALLQHTHHLLQQQAHEAAVQALKKEEKESSEAIDRATQAAEAPDTVAMAALERLLWRRDVWYAGCQRRKLEWLITEGYEPAMHALHGRWWQAQEKEKEQTPSLPEAGATLAAAATASPEVLLPVLYNVVEGVVHKWERRDGGETAWCAHSGGDKNGEDPLVTAQQQQQQQQQQLLLAALRAAAPCDNSSTPDTALRSDDGTPGATLRSSPRRTPPQHNVDPLLPSASSSSPSYERQEEEEDEEVLGVWSDAKSTEEANAFLGLGPVTGGSLFTPSPRRTNAAHLPLTVLPMNLAQHDVHKLAKGGEDDGNDEKHLAYGETRPHGAAGRANKKGGGEAELVVDDRRVGGGLLLASTTSPNKADATDPPVGCGPSTGQALGSPDRGCTTQEQRLLLDHASLLAPLFGLLHRLRCVYMERVQRLQLCIEEERQLRRLLNHSLWVPPRMVTWGTQSARSGDEKKQSPLSLSVFRTAAPVKRGGLAINEVVQQQQASFRTFHAAMQAAVAGATSKSESELAALPQAHHRLSRLQGGAGAAPGLVVQWMAWWAEREHLLTQLRDLQQHTKERPSSSTAIAIKKSWGKTKQRRSTTAEPSSTTAVGSAPSPSPSSSSASMDPATHTPKEKDGAGAVGEMPKVSSSPSVYAPSPAATTTASSSTPPSSASASEHLQHQHQPATPLALPGHAEDMGHCSSSMCTPLAQIRRPHSLSDKHQSSRGLATSGPAVSTIALSPHKKSRRSSRRRGSTSLCSSSSAAATWHRERSRLLDREREWFAECQRLERLNAALHQRCVEKEQALSCIGDDVGHREEAAEVDVKMNREPSIHHVHSLCTTRTQSKGIE